eukprot:2144960-Pleurochrysis_carterae.AAC.1
MQRQRQRATIVADGWGGPHRHSSPGWPASNSATTRGERDAFSNDVSSTEVILTRRAARFYGVHPIHGKGNAKLLLSEKYHHALDTWHMHPTGFIGHK